MAPPNKRRKLAPKLPEVSAARPAKTAGRRALAPLEHTFRVGTALVPTSSPSSTAPTSAPAPTSAAVSASASALAEATPIGPPLSPLTRSGAAPPTPTTPPTTAADSDAPFSAQDAPLSPFVSERHDFESFAQHLQDAAMFIYRQGQKSPYAQVTALMLGWDDDGKTGGRGNDNDNDGSIGNDESEAVSDLEHLLRDRYHFQTERWDISAIADLSARLATVLKAAGPDHLFVIYYAGHSYVGADNETYWANRDDTSRVKWAGLRHVLADCPSDILLFLDCSAPKEASMSGSYGAKQMIAACASEAPFCEADNRYAFTSHLARALRYLATERPFTAQRLYDEIRACLYESWQDGQNTAHGQAALASSHSPVFRSLAPGNGQTIDLVPMPRTAGPDSSRKIAERDAPLISPAAVADMIFDEPRILVCTTFVGDATPDMSGFKRWISDTPALASKVNVEGMFLGPPTMLLVSISKSLWEVIENDKIWFSLGYINSRNLIQLYDGMMKVATTPPAEDDTCTGAHALAAPDKGSHYHSQYRHHHHHHHHGQQHQQQPTPPQIPVALHDVAQQQPQQSPPPPPPPPPPSNPRQLAPMHRQASPEPQPFDPNSNYQERNGAADHSQSFLFRRNHAEPQQQHPQPQQHNSNYSSQMERQSGSDQQKEHYESHEYHTYPQRPRQDQPSLEQQERQQRPTETQWERQHVMDKQRLLESQRAEQQRRQQFQQEYHDLSQRQQEQLHLHLQARPEGYERQYAGSLQHGHSEPRQHSFSEKGTPYPPSSAVAMSLASDSTGLTETAESTEAVEPFRKRTKWEASAEPFLQKSPSLSPSITDSNTQEDSSHMGGHPAAGAGLSRKSTSKKEIRFKSPRSRGRQAKTQPLLPPDALANGVLAEGKPAGQCPHCDHEPFRESIALRKHIAVAHTRPFPCAFAFAGCTSTFGSKNEWKRHISSQHLCLQFYRCSGCSYLMTEGKVNEFNRKDLFTQHLRRMHAPPDIRKAQKQDPKAEADWANYVKGMQKTCCIRRRLPPQKSSCPKGGCDRLFEGSSAWDEWTEHVGRHMEHGEGDTLGVDRMLVAWALNEEIITQCADGTYRLLNPFGSPMPNPMAASSTENDDDSLLDGVMATESVVAKATTSTGLPATASRSSVVNDTESSSTKKNGTDTKPAVNATEAAKAGTEATVDPVTETVSKEPTTAVEGNGGALVTPPTPPPTTRFELEAHKPGWHDDELDQKERNQQNGPAAKAKAAEPTPPPAPAVMEPGTEPEPETRPSRGEERQVEKEASLKKEALADASKGGKRGSDQVKNIPAKTEDDKEDHTSITVATSMPGTPGY